MFKKSIPYHIRDKIIIESIEPQRVSDYLNTADVGIFFIKPCFSKIASCPTKFAEYLACGLPVVINSRIGDTDDVVRDNKIGVVVEKFDIEGYEKAIIGIKKLLREGNVLRQRCRDVAERCFSLE